MKGVYFGDDDAEEFDLEASVVANDSCFATTSYTRFNKVQMPQPNNSAPRTEEHEEDNAGVNSTAEPSKARKQVSLPSFFMLSLIDACYRVHLL